MAERTGAPYASVVPGVAHACGHDAHTAVLLGAALALASVPELPVGVRLIFQAAEELMPGGAIDAIAAGALTGVSRIFALHCDPRLAVGQGRGQARADHLGGRPHRGHAAFAGRAHVAAAPDRRPGVRARHADHRAARRAVAAHRPAQQHGDGVGRGQRRCRGQRHPADGHAGRNDPHRQPRDLADAGRHCAARRLRRCWRRWASSIRCSTGAACRRWSTRRCRRGSSPTRSRRIGPDVLADTRQSGGGEDFSWYLEEVPGAMARLGVWIGPRPAAGSAPADIRSRRARAGVGVRLLVNIIDHCG